MIERLPSKNGKSKRVDYRARIYERYASDWQDAAPEFDESGSRRWGKAYRYYLRGWLPDYKEARIVDLACGGGRLLYFLKMQNFTNVRGVDISKEQVQLARQVVPDVIEADVIKFLERHRDTFDLIIGLDIVEHFKKPEVLNFLDACYAALRYNGRLILQTSNADSPWGTMHRYNDFTHELSFGPNSLGRLLRLSGFGEIVARETGPVPLGYSLVSTMRYAVWRAIRTSFKIWRLAEMGDMGSGVFTQIFLISGVKK